MVQVGTPLNLGIFFNRNPIRSYVSQINVDADLYLYLANCPAGIKSLRDPNADKNHKGIICSNNRNDRAFILNTNGEVFKIAYVSFLNVSVKMRMARVLFLQHLVRNIGRLLGAPYDSLFTGCGQSKTVMDSSPRTKPVRLTQMNITRFYPPLLNTFIHICFQTLSSWSSCSKKGIENYYNELNKTAEGYCLKSPTK